MSREEAIKAIKDFQGWFKEESLIRKALDMAISALERWKDNVCTDCTYYDTEKCDTCELTGINHSALEQEPCEDAVSLDFQIGDEVRMIGSDPIYDDCDVGWVIRNASEKIKTMYVMRNDGSADEEAKAEWYRTGRHNDALAEVIKALPSVTQKSGEWIRKYDRIVNDLFWECNKCECGFQHEYNYCPNCGCRMVDPQESEEQK